MTSQLVADRRQRTRLLALGAMALGLAAAGTPATAQPGPRPFAVSADAGTDFPIDVGVRVQGELAGRFRLSTAVGLLPGAYVDAINDVLVGWDAYDRQTATLIAEALRSSLVWRTHLGLKPFAGAGFYMEGGYGMVALGGSATAGAILEAITGQTLPAGDRSASSRFDISSMLHMADVELGWEWSLGPALQLRTGIGGAFTIGARTQVDPQYAPASPRLTEAFAQYAEDYLDDIYTTYVHTPSLTVRLRTRLF